MLKYILSVYAAELQRRVQLCKQKHLNREGDMTSKVINNTKGAAKLSDKAAVMRHERQLSLSVSLYLSAPGKEDVYEPASVDGWSSLLYDGCRRECGLILVMFQVKYQLSFLI